jgi:hypothetical protein
VLNNQYTYREKSHFLKGREEVSPNQRWKNLHHPYSQRQQEDFHGNHQPCEKAH